jgi:hypothetical protein
MIKWSHARVKSLVRGTCCLLFGLLAACNDDVTTSPFSSPNSVGGNTVVAGTLSLSASTYAGAQSSGSVTVSVLRTGGSDGAVSVAYATSNGSAVAGTDYTATSGTLDWDAGDVSTKTFVVPLSSTAASGTKTFNVTLSAPGGGATLGTPESAVVTIGGGASAQPGTVSLSAATYTAGQGSVTITVDRGGGSDGAVSVAYATSDGTAVAGSNYTATQGTLTWAAGDAAAKTFSVAIDSSAFSGTKSFSVSLSNPAGGATLGSPASASVVITGSGGSGSQPGNLALSASTYTVVQSSGTVKISVNRLGGSSGAVTVAYATADGSAVAGTNYTATSGTLSWADGDTGSKSFNVAISTSGFDGTKSFSVALSHPGGGAGLGSPSSAAVSITGTGAPKPGNLALSSASYSVAQTSGAATIVVKRNGGSSGPVTVAYATANGTAIAGSTYTATSGTLSWAAGDTAAKSFTVPISTTAFSGTKTFTVTLSAPGGGATLGAPSTATVSITGSQAVSSGTLALSAASYTIAQNGGSVSVSVTRSGGSSGAVSVAYATANGTAIAGSNYTASSGTLSWADGDASAKMFTVAISNATPFSGSKSFTVALSGATGGAKLGSPGSSTVTINGSGTTATNTLQWSAGSVSVSQGAGTVSVTVTRTGSSGAVSVAYATANGSAVAGGDYTAASGTLNWADGDVNAKSFSVAISTTTPFSGSKAFTVTLSGATGGATIGSPGTETVSISGSAVASGGFGIKVSGNQFVSTKDGSPIQIVGTNISGLENGGYNSQWTQFKTAGSAFWSKVVNWGGSGINTVRLPLNEASWLNYTCYDSGSGASGDLYQASGGAYKPDPQSIYQGVIKQAVADATAAGLYVILDLHWGAPNNASGQPLCPIGQGGYADSDHSVTFWKQVADAFKGNPAVMFELFNEPFGTDTYGNWVNQNGSSYTPGPEALMMKTGGSFKPFDAQNNPNGNAMFTTNITWNVASMITLLQTIRAEGATNVVLASPIGWAGEIEVWLGTYATGGNPDPLQQFGVAWHLYGYAKGTAPPLAVLSAGYPIIVTETYGFDAAIDGGQNPNGYTWAASKGIGYMWWGWNDWDGGPLSNNLSQPPWYLSTPPN